MGGYPASNGNDIGNIGVPREIDIIGLCLNHDCNVSWQVQGYHLVTCATDLAP